jgi:hypothetical protein
MPLDLLFQCGLLLAAMAAAFSISVAVGMVVARLSATPPGLSGELDELGPKPARPDSALEAPAGRSPAESLAPVTDPAA